MNQPSASWEKLGDHKHGPLIVVSFAGAYPPGSEGSEFGQAMIAFLRSVLAETKAAGVVLDLTALDYVWGDTIAGLAMPMLEKGKGFRPAVIVATGRTARALEPLREPRILLGIAGMEMVPTRQEALAHLERALDLSAGGIIRPISPVSRDQRPAGRRGFQAPPELLTRAVVFGLIAAIVLALASELDLSELTTGCLLSGGFGLYVLWLERRNVIEWLRDRRLLPWSSSEFGPFDAAFEANGLPVAGYLVLLHLLDDDAQIVIGRIEEALRAGDSQRWVTALLADPNYRPHLVAAIAYLLDRGSRLDCAPLWAAIDAGSWVIPQLVVAALFSDPLFAGRARSRLQRRCPVTPPPSPLAADPDFARDRAGKMAASLLSVCSQVPDLAVSEPEWRADPAIQELLKLDAEWDKSEGITRDWMSSARAQFLKHGIVLVPLA